jgi:ABC-type uncharacterized transport system permease subunit
MEPKNTYLNKIKVSAFVSPNKQRVIGILFILMAVFIWSVFIRTTPADLKTTFVMTPGSSSVIVPDWVFNSQLSLEIIAGLCAGLGLVQLFRGFGKYTNLILGLAAVLLVFSFLAWGASGGSINFAGMMNVMVFRATPIVLGALAGILCERVGVVNIAIEGMMIAGAFASTIASSLFGLWAGVLCAILAGGLFATIHAFLSIKYKVNQIISGTMINIFAIGITAYLKTLFIDQQGLEYLNEPGFFLPIPIPLLSRIPVIGPVFFNHNIFVYSMYVLVIVLTIALFKTKWGLRLRAVGEHPKAADTLGINVFKTRYMAVILGGMIAGFGGAYFTLGSVGRFEEAMTAGRGFIALAAMIFGKWTPVGSFGAGLLFGFSESLSTKLSILRFPIPQEFLLMLPYVVTIIVLSGVVGRSQGPAASGVPYEKESM